MESPLKHNTKSLEDPLEKLKEYLDDKDGPIRPSHKFIQEHARKYPPFTTHGLNQLPYALMPAVAICMEDYASSLTQQVEELTREKDKLQKFKDYVHNRLDEMGIPSDPEPVNNASHGCRIEGRLNVITMIHGNIGSYYNKLEALKSELEELKKEREWTQNLLVATTERLCALARLQKGISGTTAIQIFYENKWIDVDDFKEIVVSSLNSPVNTKS